jgi:hypothetical protein
VVVEVDAGRPAQFESWLLGHGRLPKPLSADGESRRYLVKDVTDAEIADMRLVGGRVRKRE